MAIEIGKLMPFTDVLGMTVEHNGKDEVRGSIAWREELCTTLGVMHGGVLIAFADTLGAMCAFNNLPEGAGTSTIETKTNFFRAVRQGRVHGVTKPLHVGRTTIVVQTDVRNDEGKLVTQTTQTQAVIAPR